MSVFILSLTQTSSAHKETTEACAVIINAWPTCTHVKAIALHIFCILL